MAVVCGRWGLAVAGRSQAFSARINGRWRPDAAAELRTLHHQGGGAFFVAGETVQATKPAG